MNKHEKTEEITPGEPAEAPASEAQPEEPKKDTAQAAAGGLSLPQVSAELDKLTARFSSYQEIQKAANERFARINEQVGELRSLLAERDRVAQQLEAKAARAVDIVASVQPEKLMIEVQKADAKVEALRATLEANDVIMKSILSEMKEMREKMKVYRGMEEAIKMYQETKKELSQIKILETVVQKHADRVDTIFGEMGKNFSELSKVSSTLKSLDEITKQISTDVDALKPKLQLTAQKKEVEDLTNKTAEFEKQVGNVMNLINRRFEEINKSTNAKIDKKLLRADKLLAGFDSLAQKTPDLDKYFNLLEGEAKKAAEKQKVKVEKLKAPGEDGDVMEEAQVQPKKKEKPKPEKK